MHTVIPAAFVVIAATGAWAQPRPVTDERLENPEPENWLMYRGNYSGWGYSALDQINASNVHDLVPVWTFSTGFGQGHEAPPIVNDGVMFVTTPGNQVIALDVESGDLLWQYQRDLPDDVLGMHPTNRGAALYGDRVYLATEDAFVVALNASTGALVWETPVENYANGYYFTLAPLVAKGKVMVGVSGGEMGIRGFVAALDAATGEPAWKTYTIPGPGEPGNETWPGETWKTGGGSVWITGSYDPALNLTYWGTGNAAPWTGDTRPGDNLYSSSVIALDADTGELRGHHQYHWNDSWDWDEVAAPLLIDVVREGRRFSSLVHPGRNGYIWLLERKADAIDFVDAWPFVYQDVFKSIDPITGRPDVDPDKKPGIGKSADFCPSHWGGANWPPGAYNPGTGLLYVSANDNICRTMEGQEESYRPGQRFMGVRASRNRALFRHDDNRKTVGELQAWNVNTGEEVWSQEFESPNWGPVLTTAGGLVFMGGTNDRYFRAFDADTGRILWTQRTNSGINAVPTSFAVNGTQYIAVQSGWGIDAQRMQGSLDGLDGTQTHVPQGGVLWVFALRN
jgi:alcohol dehydrogenase (cytochrome c)